VTGMVFKCSQRRQAAKKTLTNGRRIESPWRSVLIRAVEA
jgi:hypothetical protein